MPLLHVERVGGLAGFGGARARIRSHGTIDSTTLSTAEQKAVETLFKAGTEAATAPKPDEFRYKISRPTATGTEEIEAPESALPSTLVGCVKDEFV